LDGCRRGESDPSDSEKSNLVAIHGFSAANRVFHRAGLPKSNISDFARENPRANALYRDRCL
jgi:hypothetical protein